MHSCLLVATREAALVIPTGDLKLVCCASCDFIGNRLFALGLNDYSPDYELRGLAPEITALA